MRVMKLWLPQTEGGLGEISAALCNNGPLSLWQSLIIQYEEDSSLSPPLSLSQFLFFMSLALFRFLYSAIYPRWPFSLSLVPCLSPCELKAEWLPTLV